MFDWRSPLYTLPKYALSIRQPWAWAIVHAGKDIENRSWETLRRGPICIHAAKRMTEREWDDAAIFMRKIGVKIPPFRGESYSPGPGERLDFGAIIGVAEIVACVTKSENPWFQGKFGFVLRDVHPIGPIPCKGAQLFFKWHPS